MLIRLLRSIVDLLNATAWPGQFGSVGAALIAGMVALTTTSALAAPEITVVQRRTTILDGGSFNFGEVRQDRSLLLTFTITNDGDTDLTISGTTVTAPFEIAAEPVPVIKAGKRSTLRVNLPAGLNPGATTGELVISNDDPNEPVFNVTLNALVLLVAPDAAVLAGNLGVPSGGPFDLGTTEAGLAIARKFTVQNTGNADLILSTPSIEGAGFLLEFPKGRKIRPGKKLNFNVRFLTTSIGSFDGLLTIRSNDPDEATYEVALLAATTPADARLRAFSQGTPLSNGDAVDFGNTQSNKKVTRTITLRNEGRATLTLGAPTLTGEGFTMLSEPRSTLSRGKSTKFKVQLDPAMTGPMPTGMISFNTNDPNEGVFLIGLGADVTQVNPQIAVSAFSGPVTSGSSVTLDVTNVNQALQSTFTISNPGSAPLEIGPISVTGLGYSLVREATSPVAPGRSTTFVVRLFSAAVLDPALGSVSFTTNVTGSASFTFGLSGAVRVVPPSPEVEVAEGTTVVNVGAVRNFGTFAAGNGLTRTYTIRNRGTSALALSALTLTNTAPVGGMGFGIQSGAPLPASIAAGTSTTFTVGFFPLAPGEFRATVSFINDDPDDGENPFTFTVTGTGTSPDISFTVEYAEASRVRLKRLANPLEPIAMRPYPFSLGAIAAGGSSVIHNQPSDSVVITNRGETPQIFSNASITDPVGMLTIWLGELVPGPCFPMPCPTPINGVVRLVITHLGFAAGPSRGLVSIDVAQTAPAFSPWEFEVQEWVDNWFPTTGGLDGTAVRAFATFDADGNGATFSPQIYAGGSFTTPAASPNIARLNGGTWEALPGGGINVVNATQVNAMTVYDLDGSGPIPPELYAGGMSISSVGMPPVTGYNNIAKYNGATGAWSFVGSGAALNGVTGGGINAMAVFTPSVLPTDPPSQLYVGGNFTGVPGNTVQGIARWDGTSWSKVRTMDDGISGGAINALAVYDSDGAGATPAELYAGGSFVNLTSLPALPANGIARFNGSLWSRLTTGLNSGVSGGGARVNALVVYDADGPEEAGLPVLVVGGSFLDAPNVASANGVATWNGLAWARLGGNGIGDFTGPGGEVFALAVYDEDAFHPDDNDGVTDSNPAGTTLRRRTQPERLYAAGNFAFMTAGGAVITNIARFSPATLTWGPVGIDRKSVV
jgi:hypothetical protein